MFQRELTVLELKSSGTFCSGDTGWCCCCCCWPPVGRCCTPGCWELCCIDGWDCCCCCCCRGCWEGWLCSLPGLAGILFSNRNSSKSIYSSWKLSPSYGRVLSHSVGPKKADWGVLRAFPSSSNFFSFSFSFPNPEGTRWRRYCHCSGKKIKLLSSFMHICVVLHADFNENITVFKSVVSLEMCLIYIILKIFLIFFMQNINWKTTFLL